MRRNKMIDVTNKQLDDAMQSALYVAYNDAKFTPDIFHTKDIDLIETNIKKFYELSNKSWLISALLMYNLVYSETLYKQSGCIDLPTYMEEARSRIGIDQREVSQMLSAARFFILYHNELIKAGWTPASNQSQLSRAELALSLCNDLDLTIEHLINDNWDDFKIWYKKYKNKKNPLKANTKILSKNGHFYYGDTEVVTISNELPTRERSMIRDCMKQIVKLLREGKVPEVSAQSEE